MALFTHLSICSACLQHANAAVFFVFDENQREWIFRWLCVNRLAVFFAFHCFGTGVTCLYGCCISRMRLFFRAMKLFSLSYIVCRLFIWVFRKMEHTHIYINKIVWPRLQMQTQCSTLSVCSDTWFVCCFSLFPCIVLFLFQIFLSRSIALFFYFDSLVFLIWLSVVCKTVTTKVKFLF